MQQQQWLMAEAGLYAAMFRRVSTQTAADAQSESVTAVKGLRERKIR